MRFIVIECANEYVKGAGVPIGAAGSYSDVALKIKFSDMWDGMSKHITWLDANGENPTIVYLTAQNYDGEYYTSLIPAEAKAVAGTAVMSIKGADSSKGTLTAKAEFKVLESVYDENAEESVQPTPSVADQLQEQIEDVLETIADARAAATEAAASEASAADSAASALASQNAAAESAASASGSAESAASSASSASGSASSASSSASAAYASEVAAADSESAAGISAANAAESESSAASSASSAAASAADAAEYVDTVVSAASAAAASEANAAASETATAGYANSASGSASSASASASAAASSAANAAASETAAKSAETNAAASKTAAAASESAAAGSAANAANSASAASGSASAAYTSAESASGSATAASSSATAAAGSAAAAAASAASVSEQASDAEAAARGTRNGEAVGPDDEFYNDNAKYWKDQAAAIVGPSQPKITATGMLKGNGDGDVVSAVAGTDYAAASHNQALSTITGADDLKAIEALSGMSGFLKKTAANSWSLDTSSYLETETDPTVPSWAKASTKPAYTAAEVGALPDDTEIPEATTTTPAMDGTASVGSETAWAKGDHVHPTDTSRQAKITASGILKGNGQGGVTAATAGTDYQAPITNPVTGTGTSGTLAKFNGASSVTDGPALGSDTTTFLRNDGSWETPPGTYTHPSYAAATAAAVKVGRDSSGHVTIGNALAASDVGAAASSHNHAAGDINSGTLGVARGGTGAASFTANSVVMSGSSTTAALTTRAVTNNTSSTALAANTNIPTQNTVYYGLNHRLNRTTAVNAADTGYTTYMARGEALNSADTNPTVNGAISWTYA